MGFYSLNIVEGPGEVSEDIGEVLDANGEADEVRGYSGFDKLLLCELAVGMAGGMEHTAAGVGHVGGYGDHPQGVHEADGRLTVTFKAEA